jgi:hypothetical protein
MIHFSVIVWPISLSSSRRRLYCVAKIGYKSNCMRHGSGGTLSHCFTWMFHELKSLRWLMRKALKSFFAKLCRNFRAVGNWAASKKIFNKNVQFGVWTTKFCCCFTLWAYILQLKLWPLRHSVDSNYRFCGVPMYTFIAILWLDILTYGGQVSLLRSTYIYIAFFAFTF